MRISSLNDIASLASYFNRIHAEPRSLRTAVVRESHGIYYRDLAVIRIGRDGKIDAPDDYMPTPGEVALIQQEFVGLEWPTIVKLATKNELLTLPPELRGAELFPFRNVDDKLEMIQQRVVYKDGSKHYVPWTYWDDDQWRRAEPEGYLPLYGMERIGHHTKIFLHEGAKSAETIMQMLKNGRDHPWAQDLAMGAHIGWIGGALNPGRTDWESLNRLKPKQIIIIADNDENGVDAIKAISYHLRCQTFCIRFNNSFPVSFDMGDEMPPRMFHKDAVGRRYYKGPALLDLMEPATWATDVLTTGTGKSQKRSYMLRDSFTGQWGYVADVDSFVNLEDPMKLYPEAVFNKIMDPYSHVENTAKMLYKRVGNIFTSLSYQPGDSGRIVNSDRHIAINTHVPSVIKPISGDPQPWFEFMEYLIPEVKERLETYRWVATLLAQPDVHMEYGLMLISETQGIGKTTLASRILAPLVGQHNVSHPTEEDIMSSFNGWLARKRLVVVAEIYQGRSWKAYHKLKSLMTDRTVMVNEKYQQPHTIENFAHFVASSNSPKALKLEDEDRRWFYPTVTEKAWSVAKFKRFFDWLEREGGLGIILDWAINKFSGEYVFAGERAPMTKAKKVAIENSRSEVQQELIEILERIDNKGEAVTFLSRSVMAYFKQKYQSKMFDTFHDLKKAAISVGWHVHWERVKKSDFMQYVLMSPAMVELVREKFDWEPEAVDNFDKKAFNDFVTTEPQLKKIQDYSEF